LKQYKKPSIWQLQPLQSSISTSLKKNLVISLQIIVSRGINLKPEGGARRAEQHGIAPAFFEPESFAIVMQGECDFTRAAIINNWGIVFSKVIY
jgi:hypothetical protein